MQLYNSATSQLRNFASMPILSPHLSRWQTCPCWTIGRLSYTIQPMKPTAPARRAWPATITLWGVFLIGVWNAGRAYALWQQADLLRELGARPNPTILIGLAIIWALIWFGWGVMLWQKRPFTCYTIPATLIIYALYEISLLTWLAATPPPQQGWRFHTLLFTIMTLFSMWSLNNPTALIYYRLTEDGGPQTDVRPPSSVFGHNRKEKDEHE